MMLEDHPRIPDPQEQGGDSHGTRAS